MIKSIKELEVIRCLEVTIEHPIVENNEVSMLVSMFPNKRKYIFSIPHDGWTYETENGEEINPRCAPSGFNHPKYKKRLITAMNQAIEIIENSVT